MQTLVAVYDNLSDAQAAVNDLVNAGFNRRDISLMASDAEGRYTGELESTAEGTATGAVTGGVLGGVTGALIGLAALAIPGIGPVVA
ncbi:MAG: general stress protein, partial [Candidatus Promineifilaceae bacterium]